MRSSVSLVVLVSLKEHVLRCAFSFVLGSITLFGSHVHAGWNLIWEFDSANVDDLYDRVFFEAWRDYGALRAGGFDPNGSRVDQHPSGTGLWDSGTLLPGGGTIPQHNFTFFNASLDHLRMPSGQRETVSFSPSSNKLRTWIPTTTWTSLRGYFCAEFKPKDADLFHSDRVYYGQVYKFEFEVTVTDISDLQTGEWDLVFQTFSGISGSNPMLGIYLIQPSAADVNTYGLISGQEYWAAYIHYGQVGKESVAKRYLTPFTEGDTMDFSFNYMAHQTNGLVEISWTKNGSSSGYASYYGPTSYTLRADGTTITPGSVASTGIIEYGVYGEDEVTVEHDKIKIFEFQ